MKRPVLFKSLMMFFAIMISFNIASIPHSMKAVSHGKVVLEDNTASASVHVEEQKGKHLDLSGVLQSKVLINLVLMVFFTTLLCSSNIRRMLKHFLYSVYYQSSYFSKLSFTLTLK
ncbi:hypothetical protein ABET41_09235 [Metabacillus fastidiosus]|uniref:hypothetical protein n=1 Tax=Metabacillus fastidiosus TaxID=1458 RepID=UPI003D265212